jgi:hypothetical protein
MIDTKNAGESDSPSAMDNAGNQNITSQNTETNPFKCWIIFAKK